MDILHKKTLIFFGAIAGSWFYSIEFLKSLNIFLHVVGLILIILFLFFIIGLIVNFFRLNKISKNLQRINSELK
jgi:flagellar biogenesis protein FliO